MRNSKIREVGKKIRFTIGGFYSDRIFITTYDQNDTVKWNKRMIGNVRVFPKPNTIERKKILLKKLVNEFKEIINNKAFAALSMNYCGKGNIIARRNIAKYSLENKDIIIEDEVTCVEFFNR